MGSDALFIGRMLVVAGVILAGPCPVALGFHAPGRALGPALLAQDAAPVETSPPGPAPDAGPSGTAGTQERNAAEKSPSGGGLVLLAILAAGALAAWWSWRRGLVHPEPGRPDAPREGPAAELVAGPGWPILLLAGLLIWLAQALGAGSAVTLLGLSGADALTLRGIALTALGGYTGSIAAAAVTALTVPGLVRTIGVRARWADARSGAAGFVLILPIVLAVGVVASTAAAWIAGLLGTPPPSELAHATLRLLAAPGPGEGLWSALTIVAVVLGAPIAEEVIYRGHLQTGLRLAFGPGSAARWGAVVLTSMLFALMHAGIADLHALPTLLVLSIGLGIAYERTGSLAVPACIHALFNAANIALAWLPG